MNRLIGTAATLLVIAPMLTGCVTRKLEENDVRGELAELSQRGPVPTEIHDLENLLSLLIRRDLRADCLEIGAEPTQIIENDKPREGVSLIFIADVPDEAITPDAVEAVVRHAIGVAGYRALFIWVVDHQQSHWSVKAILEPLPPVIAARLTPDQQMRLAALPAFEP